MKVKILEVITKIRKKTWNWKNCESVKGVVIHKRNEELVFKFVKCQFDETCDSNYEKSSIYNEKMLKCNEFRVAAQHGLGPYRKFGLSRIFDTWNYVIGDNQII